MNRNHEEFKMLMMKYIDGEAINQESREFELHLESCAECTWHDKAVPTKAHDTFRGSKSSFP